MKVKLSLGILFNEFNIPLWQYQILEKLIISDFSEIKLIIKDSSSGSHYDNLVYPILYKLHIKLDKLIFSNKNDYGLKTNLSNLLNDVPCLEVSPVKEGLIYVLNEEDCKKLKVINLDVIINFSFTVLKGSVLTIPKYGIWHYSFSDICIDRNSPAGYWEVITKRPETGLFLKMINKNKETTIYRSWGSTYAFSISINRNGAYNRALLMIPRVLKGIFDNGESYFNKLVKKYNKDIKINKPVPYSLTSFIAFKNLFIHAVIIFKQLVKKLMYTNTLNWSTMYKINNYDGVGFSTSFHSFQKQLSPKDRFWADPFVISKNNKFYIYVEEFLYKTNKGHISVLELNNKGALINLQRIIEKPYHMSYPFIFESNNTYYMIPETGENKTIELFKCTSFPDKWDFVMNLMENITARDTTLFYYINKWWLFTSINESGNTSDYHELFLFSSADLFSNKWKSHPDNPVVSDVKTARSAGKIFIHDNKIYRPSQDCSGIYGRAFNLNRIVTLNETEYEESLEIKVEPNWNSHVKGIHTYNFDHNITVIDAYTYRKRLPF